MSLIGSLKEFNLNEIPYEGSYQKDNDIDPSSVQLKAKITYKIFDKDGKLVKIWEEGSHSLLNQFVAFMLLFWSNQTGTIIDVSGVNYNMNGASPGNISLNAGSGIDSYGIVVGSASQSVSNLVNRLVAPIPNGLGAGQLLYQAMSFPTSVINSGNTTLFQFSRNFINNSGSTLSISEIGIIGLFSGFGNASTDYILLSYDVPSSPISLANGQTLQITYTFQATA